MRYTIVGILLAFLFVFPSCSSLTTPEAATPAKLHTITPTFFKPMAEQIKSTPTISLSVTLVPLTSTAIPSTLTPKSEISPTPETSSPTPSITPLGMSKFPQTYTAGLVMQSPDGQWLWAVEYNLQDPPEHRFDFTHIVRADGQVEWKIQFDPKNLPEKDPPTEVWYQPLFWSEGGTYVYLAGNGCCFDGPIYFGNGYNLARLDLRTGKLTVKVSGWRYHDFTFSADGKYLLDIPFSADSLKVTLLEAGQTRTYPLRINHWQSGDAAMSPDQKYVAVQNCVVTNNFDATCDKFALLLVEIDSGKSRELVADEYKVMGLDGSKINEAPPFKWKDNSTIQLGIWNPSKIWLVDINTGNITYSEKTPNP